MRVLAICVLVLSLFACKAKKDDENEPGVEASNGGPAVVAKGAPPAIPRRAEAPCPECDGYGSCRRCGDFRPCLLCDGGGTCPICHGDGEGRDGACEACAHSGNCPECGGDGVVSRLAGDIGAGEAPMPGVCPECLFGTGLCPDCGGAGLWPDGSECVRCGGAKWCPDCRGTGRDAWCSGRSVCPSCEGHGQVVNGRPGTGWPKVRLALNSGETVIATILDRPGETLNIERTQGTRAVRESIVAKKVDPLGYLTALRRYLDAGRAADFMEVAEFALAHGEEFVPLATVSARGAESLGERSPRLATIRSEVARRAAATILSRARTALRDRKDARTAWELYQLVSHAYPAASPGAVRAGCAEAEALLAAEEEGLSGERRARRLKAEEERLRRAVRRAREWRGRAEELLGRTGADPDALLRAFHAAERARRDLCRAVSRSPADLDRSGATTGIRRAREVGVRAMVALALGLLEDGLGERARSVTALALARDPENEEAKRVAAVVSEALARAGTAPEEGR